MKNYSGGNAFSQTAAGRARGTAAAFLLGGLSLLAGPQTTQAQVGIQDAASDINYGTTALNASTFKVSSNASVLVVFYGSRTQNDSGATDQGPPTLSWNGHALMLAVWTNGTEATWDDSAIYYLNNPPAGTGALTGALPSAVNQNWWMAYTLSNISTTIAPLTGKVGNSNPQTISDTVSGVAAGDWAAVTGMASAPSATCAITDAPSGGTVSASLLNTDGNASVSMGSVENLPAGANTFTVTTGAATPKLTLVEAIFTPVPPPIPATPTGLSAIGENPPQVNLSWNASAYATSYNLARGVNSGVYTVTNVVTGTNYTDTQVASGTAYYYAVAAVDASGSSAYSAPESATPFGPPSAPTLTAANFGTGQVRLSWTLSSGATNYNVKRSTVSGAEAAIVSVTGTSYTNAGLAPGTAYFYEVSAAGAGGQSANSSEVRILALDGWYLFDNFNADAAGALNGQTGSEGLGAGWTNFGGGSPISVAGGALFGGGNDAQYNINTAAQNGDYEAGLGIAGASGAATVFLQFRLPGIQNTNGEVTGTDIVSMNICIDTNGAPVNAAANSSAQFNYDNSSSTSGFRINAAGTFEFIALSANTETAYTPVPGNIYDLWFVLDAAGGTYQVYLADASVAGTNLDSGGLGAAPTLLYELGASLSSFGFRNPSTGVGLNTFVTAPGSQLGTVAQAQIANIYVDSTSADLVNPLTGLLPFGLSGLSATGLQATSATLGGDVVSTGGSVPAAVTIYYGPTDGGTNAGAWAFAIPLGQQTGAFAQTVTGLSSDATYYFSAEGSNAAGVQWAAPSLSFTTVAIGPPEIANEAASAIGATAATLNGQLLSTGGLPTSVTLYYGLTDGASNAANWTSAIPLGQQTGAFAQTITGLSSNTGYFFTAQASNLAGVAWAAPSLSFATLASNPPVKLVSVLTYKYDNTRDGANTNEVLLTPANVNANNFARLFSYTLDGYCYSTPLYVAGVQIPGQGTHNVVFISTENDSVYAFDADSNAGPNGGLLWHTNLGIAQISVDNYATRYYHNLLSPLIGITSTPVIDPGSGTIYVDTFVGPVANTNIGYHVLHALNITNGTEQPYSPVVVRASVPGVGRDSVNGVVSFDSSNSMNRPAMTLFDGILYVSYGSYGDTDPYHGWVIGYNATNLEQLTNYVFASTPDATTNDFGVNAGEGALWMGGSGLCVDSDGNLYFETANGSFSANTNGRDYADTFVKLSTTNGLAVGDYFTPWDQNSMAVNDLDLGSGGPLLLPDSVGSAAHPHLMTGAGKEGTIYLVDRDNMGKYIITTSPNASKDTQIVQELQSVIGGVWGSPAYWNHLIYWQGAGDVLKAYGITNGVLTSSPVTENSTSIGNPAIPSISANGTSNGIAWIYDSDAYNNNGPGGTGILYAFNATNLAQELYNSSQNPTRDNPGSPIKYAVPIVANGKVYVRGEYVLSVFGLGDFPPSPLIAPNGGLYSNSVTITLTDASNTASIYYTLDGTTPTVNSLLYTGPFVLTNSAAVNAFAVQQGIYNSATVSATFINSSSIGSGAGLLGQYWANTSSAAFTNAAFNIPPTMTRTDAIVNFNWGGAGPGGGIPGTNYVVRWTGSIQPQFSETCTFYVTSDDGARLYVNGQLLIDDWMNQSAGVESNSITMAAQQLYNIELDYYYQNDSGAQVSLAWSSPSLAQTVVPQTQLYPYTNPPPAIVLSSPANGSIYTATASVSLEAMADATYNAISKVDFYANGNWLGALNSSPNAPLYSLTATGFGPQPGGQSAASAQAAATPTLDSNLTTTNVEPAGEDWTAAIWQSNGVGTAVAPVAGHTYSLAFNGAPIGNGLNNTRIRSPDTAGSYTFPGDSLTLNTNTELRLKFTTAITLDFPAVGANPGLILNGGLIDDGSDGLATITGSVEITGQSYDAAQGENGGGGGLAANPRSLTLAATLSGSGNLVIMDCSTNQPEIISGVSNTFSGRWIVQCGWLQGAASNSLGTNSITVDPLYLGYLAEMPGASSPQGPALFEVNYNIASAGALTLANGGLMNLHQTCAFAAVTIEGTSLSPGTYTYAQLASRFPNNFLPNGSGSITVSPAPISPPGPVSAPTGLSAAAGNAEVFLSWNASPGATNYNIQRSTNSGGPYSAVAGVAGTSYTDAPLANGTTYYYAVSAVSPPGYCLTAVATDASGLSSTSPPVQIMVNAGSGLPYGLTTNGTVARFLNMPAVMPASLPGTVPPLLSETGVYANTPNRAPAGGLISYSPNTPLWSDGAQKSRYMAVPNNGGLVTPSEQIAFAATNSWTFPSGTVFVKNFDLVVNATNPAVPARRLETRLLVRDTNGAVYGVTYKWRPDNSDADLLTSSLNENILVTNAAGVTNQTWYYPSPADCLTCHTAVADYVLGISTRQLNGNLTYAATGNTDNQLRVLNRLGLFYPAINEANITNYAQLSSLTNLSASLEQRSRSYLDANCAQCHQPGGTGITFDARYDTPLALQNITNYPAQLSLGIDNACIIKAQDVWRSVMLVRINTNNPTVQMPPLARNLIDTNAVQVFTAWINSLPGAPALAPPSILPYGGTFLPSVSVTLQPSAANEALYFTLDGALPTTNSFLYSAPFLLTNSATVSANAFGAGFNNSVAARASFLVLPGISLTSAGFAANGAFQLSVSGLPGSNYVLQATTNFRNWTSLATNLSSSNVFQLLDTNAANIPFRFYRILEPPGF